MKKRAVYSAILILALLHQDFWFWDDPSLVWGFLPIGLAYHCLYSVVAGLAWYLAMKYAWPDELDALGHAKAKEGAPPE